MTTKTRNQLIESQNAIDKRKQYGDILDAYILGFDTGETKSYEHAAKLSGLKRKSIQNFVLGITKRDSARKNILSSLLPVLWEHIPGVKEDNDSEEIFIKKIYSKVFSNSTRHYYSEDVPSPHKEIESFIFLATTEPLKMLPQVNGILKQFAKTWIKSLEIKKALIKDKSYALAKVEINKLLGNPDAKKLGEKLHSMDLINTRTRAYLCDLMGSSLYHLGEIEDSEKFLIYAIELGTLFYKSNNIDQINDEPDVTESWTEFIAAAHDHLGDVYRITSQKKDAVTNYDKSIDCSKEIGDLPGELRGYRKICLLDLSLGKNTKNAIKICETNINTLDNLEEISRRASYEKIKYISTKGFAHNIRGEISLAIDCHTEAIRLWENLDEHPIPKSNEYEILKNERYLATDFLNGKNFVLANMHFENALLKTVDLGIDFESSTDAEIGMIHFELANLQAITDTFEDALAEYKIALTIIGKSKDPIRASIVKRKIENLRIFKQPEKINWLDIENKLTGLVNLFSNKGAYGYSASTTLDLLTLAIITKNNGLFDDQATAFMMKLNSQTNVLEDSIKDKLKFRFFALSSLKLATMDKDYEGSINNLEDIVALAGGNKSKLFFLEESYDLFRKVGIRLWENKETIERLKSLLLKIKTNEKLTEQKGLISAVENIKHRP